MGLVALSYAFNDHGTALAHAKIPIRLPFDFVLNKHIHTYPHTKLFFANRLKARPDTNSSLPVHQCCLDFGLTLALDKCYRTGIPSWVHRGEGCGR